MTSVNKIKQHVIFCADLTNYVMYVKLVKYMLK